MFYTSDWHIHCEGSYDASLTVPHILEKAKEYGITDLGITDHVNIPSWISYLKKSRELFDANRQPGFHFGVELTTQSKARHEYAMALGAWSDERWNQSKDMAFEPYQGYTLPLTEEELRSLQVEFVVAGAHWSFYVPLTREDLIRDYALQNLYMATDPRVDIVAHPWWYDAGFRNKDGVLDSLPWFDDFGVIPRSIHNEFAAALKENGKCMEWNITSFICTKEYTEKFCIQYAEYVREMFEMGVPITIGSDEHHEYPDFQDAVERIASKVGFKPEDFSHPKFRTY